MYQVDRMERARAMWKRSSGRIGERPTGREQENGTKNREMRKKERDGEDLNKNSAFFYLCSESILGEYHVCVCDYTAREGATSEKYETMDKHCAKHIRNKYTLFAVCECCFSVSTAWFVPDTHYTLFYL